MSASPVCPASIARTHAMARARLRSSVFAATGAVISLSPLVRADASHTAFFNLDDTQHKNPGDGGRTLEASCAELRTLVAAQRMTRTVYPRPDTAPAPSKQSTWT